jgi:hypothetical protein
MVLPVANLNRIFGTNHTDVLCWRAKRCSECRIIDWSTQYLQEWFACKEMWSDAWAPHVSIFKVDTNNLVERFFKGLKYEQFCIRTFLAYIYAPTFFRQMPPTLSVKSIIIARHFRFSCIVCRFDAYICPNCIVPRNRYQHLKGKAARKTHTLLVTLMTTVPRYVGRDQRDKREGRVSNHRLLEEVRKSQVCRSAATVVYVIVKGGRGGGAQLV